MNWTVATYRLNEVVRTFDLPCVIRLTEGYYPNTESEEFSQGDVLTIDTEMVSDKVAANFTTENGRFDGFDDYGEYVLLKGSEILVPLKYKGKVKVLKYIKNIDTVKELATYFPRYTKLRENLVVNAGESGQVTILADTLIELDRIIPGSKHDSCTKPDKLVIQFELMDKVLVAELPVTSRGKFRTEEDVNEYTLKEAVDRYGLPLDVKFVDDEIKRVYTPDILEGVENVKSITGTLRLNRIVTQHALIAHYNAVEVDESLEAEQIRRRPIIVLPVDNPEIGNIEVNVMAGDKHEVLEVYEKMLNVINVSHTRAMVESCLIVDFTTKPGIKCISNDVSETCLYANIGFETISVGTNEHAVDAADDTPPRIPDRPIKPAPETDASGIHVRDTLAALFNAQIKLPATERQDDPGGYEKPATRKPELSVDYVDMCFTRNINPDTCDESLPAIPPRLKPSRSKGTKPRKSVLENKHQKGKSFWSNLKSTMQGHLKPVAEIKPSPHSPHAVDYNGGDNVDVYKEMHGLGRTLSAETKHCTHSSKTPVDDINEDYEKINELREADVVQIKPCNQTSEPEYEELNATNFPNFMGNRTKAIPATIPKLKEAGNSNEICLKPTPPRIRSLSRVRRTNINGMEGGTLASVVKSNICNPFDAETTGVAHFNNKPDYGEIVHSISTESRKASRKKFKDLSSDELVERLMMCNLQDMAGICKSAKLNGEFFDNVALEFLTESMGLNGLQQAIFLKMRDENWVSF